MAHLSTKYLVVLAGVMLIANLTQIGCTTSRQFERKNDVREKVDIGYGSMDEENVTGSVATIHTDDPGMETATSVADILRGRVAGVDVFESPGGGIQFRIRGTGTIMGQGQPLIVLDGFALHTTDGVLYDINPHDIASITVLKDAASTAIYGIRGAHGVIIIKTKLGH